MRLALALTAGVAAATGMATGVAAQEVAREPAQAVTDDADDALFLAANVEWVLDHEMAHALIDAFDLPVLGQEEDAADSFASASVSARHPEPEAARRLALVAELWFLEAERTDEAERTGAGDGPDYFAEHDLDIQRGFRVLCVANGADPAVAEAALDFVDVPDGGFDGCEVDRDLATESWDVLIGPNTLYDDEPPADVSVEYGPAGGLEVERAALEATGAMEALAEEAAGTYALFDPLVIAGRACGEPDAFFDPEAGEIVVCYEFVGDIVALRAASLAAEVSGDAEPDGATNDATDGTSDAATDAVPGGTADEGVPR